VRNDAGGIQSIQSKLHLIDLAGSEKIRHLQDCSYVSETRNINKSLCTLSIVIRRLANLSKENSFTASLSSLSSPASLNKLPATSSTRRCRFVPYRDSKLTWLLRDSLGGNAKTTVIITVSPSIRHIRETVNALRFSQRIKLIRNRPTSIKMHPRHKGLGMQLLRHQGLQTSCDDIVHRSSEFVGVGGSRRHQRSSSKLFQRSTQCPSLISPVDLNRSLAKRICNSLSCNYEPMGIDYCTHSALTNERGCQTNHVEESSDQPAHLLSKVIHDSALLDYADKHTDLSMESPRCTPNAEAGEAVATVASSEYCDANRNADDLENQFSATRPHFATMSYPPDIISTTVSVQRPHCNLDSSQLENSSAEAISTDSLE
uniref:Kinesin-like protein n=2 Tax=Mesocestoides corti TaxID=53468 RepID=A0A5K3FAC6_MESCO